MKTLMLKQKLSANGPKRILSLDGGGIKGIFTLQILEKIEEILKEKHKHINNFKLCDYFDLIGGTSTGSIIAACLSIGMSVVDIKSLYLKLGEEIFAEKRSLFRRYTGAKFSERALQNALSDTFKGLTLGDKNLRTGLCIVTKRADSGSTWPLINHPDGKYFDQNKGILLKNAVRASAAAPTYFVPEKLEVGHGEEGVFIDGGVSMYNNPSLLLFMIATLSGYAFKWPTGEDNILIVSVGTGSSLSRNSIGQIMGNRKWNWGLQIPDMLMRDASAQSHLLLQYMSNSPTRSSIDSEIGDMKGDLLGKQTLLSYLRYSVNFEINELNSLGITDTNIKALGEMSDARNIKTLVDIGKAVANQKVNKNHFNDNFDIKH